jgi:MOSC domain-containing protein
MRFRANVFVDGLPAWSELDAIGQEFDLGGVRVRTVYRTKRCAATCVSRAMSPEIVVGPYENDKSA